MQRPRSHDNYRPGEGQLSAVLLGDLRVETADCAVVELGAGGGVRYGEERASVFHLVLAGRCVVRPPDECDPVELSAGDCALFFYGDDHCVGLSRRPAPDRLHLTENLHFLDIPPTLRFGSGGIPRARLLSARLSYGYLSPAAFANRSGPDCRIVRADAAPGEERALRLDLDQIASSLAEIGGTAFAKTLISLQLIPMLRGIQRELWRERPIEVRTPVTRQIGAAIHAMHAHPERGWAVADLAQAVGLSRSTFAAAFAAHTGEPPLTYLTRLRMDHAAVLLADTNIPLSEIARRSGYSVEHSFARAFRRHSGMSPRVYARGCGAASPDLPLDSAI